jgi:aminomethyltransferase
MYSPMLQRHIALTRVRPELAAPGTPVKLELDVNHRYEYVAARTARLPLYNPTRKTA